MLASVTCQGEEQVIGDNHYQSGLYSSWFTYWASNQDSKRCKPITLCGKPTPQKAMDFQISMEGPSFLHPKIQHIVWIPIDSLQRCNLSALTFLSSMPATSYLQYHPAKEILRLLLLGWKKLIFALSTFPKFIQEGAEIGYSEPLKQTCYQQLV